MSAELVPVAAALCPECQSTLTEITVHQPALFIQAGYGATKRTVTAMCPRCLWSVKRSVCEVNPRS